MSLSLLPTNAVLINQVAVTVYGVAPGATIQTNYEAYAKDNGIDATLNLLLNSAGLGTDANFNAIVLANLGLASDAVSVAYMESSVAANGRLATMKAAFNFLGSVAGQDNAYGTAGTAFNSKVTKSIEYSSVATNTNYSANAVSESALAAGTNFTLVTGLDSLSGSAGADSAFSTITGTASTTTLEAGDAINLGDGVDTLNITMSGGDYSADANISGVEIFSMSATGGARAFDADGLEGMQKLVNTKSSSNLTVTNMESVNSVIGINKDSTINTTSVTWKNAALAGTDDTVAIELDGVTAAEIISLRSSGTNDIENVTIASNGSVENFMGAFTVEDSGAAATMAKLTVTGAANLDMDASALEFAGSATTASATFDASQMTGRVKVDLDETTNLRMTATGGAGSDTFDFGDSLDSNDTVDMGDGTDTIKVDAIADGATSTLATTYNLSNVEVFQATGADEASFTVNALGQAGLEKIIFVENADGGDDNGDTYTATNLAAGVSVQVNNTVNSRDMNTLTVSLEDASGTADSLTVTTAGTATHGTDNNLDDISISDIETLNIVSTFVGSTVLGAAEVNTIDDISADTTLTAINVSGTEKTTITLGAEMTKLATFDASGTSDDVTVDASGLSSKTTFTGGSREDTFTMGATLNNEDTIDGGADGTASGENDTVTATVTGLTSVTGALNISNVEVIDLTNGGTATINAAGITGADSINVFATSDTTNFTNLASGATIGLGKTASADQVIGTVDVKLADATGTADVVNFGVNEATSATLTGTAIETVNLVLSTTDTDIAESTLTVSALNAATINISGANADTGHTLGLGTLDTDTTTLDASAYRGILTAQASTAGTTVSLRGGAVHDVTGGTGNDTFTISKGAAQYNVDGGAGTDTLTMEVNGSVDTNDIANFETATVNVTASADATIVLATGEFINDSDMTKLTVAGGNGISTFTMGGAAMGATGAGADAIGIAAGSEATGLTQIDGSGFAGNMTLTFGDGVVDNSLTIKGGAGTTDTVNAAYAGGTDTVHLQGIEYFKIQADATANVDLTDTTGLTRVYVDDDNTAAATTLTDLAAGVGVYFTTGVTASSVTIDMEDATGTSDSLNVELVSSVGSSTLTVTNVETLNLDVEGAFSLDLGATTMSTSGATSTLNVTGDSALTLAGTDTDIRTIDASGMSTGGSVIQTAREATGASTYTGSLGADTFIYNNSADVMVGGSGSDTLDINMAAILGGLSVDLSSTTNQIVSINGSSPSGSVTGFENADASGYTGSFGALLTGSSAANTLTGTSNADQISGGAGADTVIGGAGADTVTTGDGADTVELAAIAVAGSVAGADTVKDFTAGASGDIVRALDSAYAWAMGTTDGTVVLATGTDAAAAHATDGNATVLTISDNVITHTVATYAAGTSTIAELEGTIATALGTTLTATMNAQHALIAVDDGASTMLVRYSDGGTNGAVVGELSLIGILEGVSDATTLVAGNFAFA